MKTAIYIEDGIVQLVITPESDFEKDSLNSFSDKPLEVKVFSGSFYDCRGGWIRQQKQYQSFTRDDNNDKSLILTMRQPEQVKPKHERIAQLEAEIAELNKQDETLDFIDN